MKSLLDRLVSVMNNFGTVVRFTVMNKLRAKSFIISTLVFMLIISVAVNIPYIITLFKGDDADKVKTIGYIQSENSVGSAIGQQLEQYFAAVEGSTLQLKAFSGTGDALADETVLRKELSDGKLHSYIEFGEATESGFPSVVVKSEKLLDFSVASQIESVLQIIRQNNILANAWFAYGFTSVALLAVAFLILWNISS